METKPSLIAGTWGLAAFDTAPRDTGQLIRTLHRAGARKFDSALAYGDGALDYLLGQES